MEPGKYDIKLIKGTTERRSFRWLVGEDRTPVNLTGYSVTVHVTQQMPESPIAGIASIRLPQSTPDNTGWIDVTFDNSLTSTLTFEEGEWYLTLIDPGGEPSRLIEGLVRVRD